ncbi:MAG TPA: hypothetical protein VF190_05795 [Rhodothermales bacterium]
MPFKLALAASVLVSACDSGPDSPAPPDSILPLEVGNRWIFERTLTDATGDTLLVEPDTVTIVGDTLIANERWFVVAGSSPHSQNCFGGLEALRDDGIWFRADAASPAYLQFACPAEDGTSYPYAPQSYVGEATVASTSAETPGQPGHPGYLYEVRLDSMLSWPNFAFAPNAPPLRRLLIPGVGFAEFQLVFWRTGSGRYAQLAQAHTWRLVDFQPATHDGRT